MKTGVALKKIGTGAEARRNLDEHGRPEDIPPVRNELEQAPPEYRKGIASVVTGDVFKDIAPQYPVLLKRQTEHRMTVADLIQELALIVSMGDIKDPETSVFIYSLQLENPANTLETAGWKFIQRAALKESFLELKNGYVNHDLLYELTESERSMVLLNVLQQAKKVRLSLKPPWSDQRVDVSVEICT
jgi:hypothetical protein